MMRKIVSVLLGSLFAASAFAQQPEAGVIDTAKASALHWVDEVDHGQYAESWDEAAKIFRNAVNKGDWQQAITSARAPFGAIEKRELVSATYAEQLPGSPPGKYVVIQYRTQFAGGKSANETVTPMKDADGNWRVAGYYIK
jgi:hypothetical protein